MSSEYIVVIEIFAPLVLLIAYARFKLMKSRRKAAADLEAGGDSQQPFKPSDEPALNFFYRRFTLPQRTYLRGQMGLAKVFFPILGWIFIVIFTAGLLPDSVNEFGVEQPLAQRVWYSYLNFVSLVGSIGGIIVFLSALVAVSGLSKGGQATFFRVRPITLRFIFWARMLPALATMLGSVATGLAVSFLVLLVSYGPVWLHLSDATSGLSQEQASNLAQTLQTSAPRLFFSLLTTEALTFAVVSVFLSQPFQGGKQMNNIFRGVFVFVGGLVGIEGYRLFSSLHFLSYGRALFIYLHLGPPPPYEYVLVPILLSAALLFVAQKFYARAES